MTLRPPGRFGNPWYGCDAWRQTGCRGSHGAHPDGTPLGVPADQVTKAARIRAHDAFDRLWKSGLMRRPSAYRWMQRAMGLQRDDAHIGRFTSEQCDQLIVLVERYLDGQPRRQP